MPNKYNKIDTTLIEKRAWKELVASLKVGGYIFAVPDAVAIDSLSVTVARFNNEADDYRIAMNADKANLGVTLTVTRRGE